MINQQTSPSTPETPNSPEQLDNNTSDSSQPSTPNPKPSQTTNPTISNIALEIKLGKILFKISGQNLFVLEKSNISVVSSNKSLDFEIENPSSSALVLKFKETLSQNQMIKITITNSNSLEFQYNEITFSSATMKENSANKVVAITISGKNLDILKDNLIKNYEKDKDSKIYSISLYNQTTGATFEFYNNSSSTK